MKSCNLVQLRYFIYIFTMVHACEIRGSFAGPRHPMSLRAFFESRENSKIHSPFHQLPIHPPKGTVQCPLHLQVPGFYSSGLDLGGWTKLYNIVKQTNHEMINKRSTSKPDFNQLVQYSLPFNSGLRKNYQRKNFHRLGLKLEKIPEKEKEIMLPNVKPNTLRGSTTHLKMFARPKISSHKLSDLSEFFASLQKHLEELKDDNHQHRKPVYLPQLRSKYNAFTSPFKAFYYPDLKKTLLPKKGHRRINDLVGLG